MEKNSSTFNHTIKNQMKKIVIIGLVGMLGALVGVGAYKIFENKEPDNFAAKQSVHFASERTPMNNLDGLDFTAAAAITTPAVVHIKVTVNARPQARGYNFDPFRDFFGDRGFGDMFGNPGPQMGSGSGVIISPDGYIATNNHVVRGADKIEVVLNDKRSYTGKIIGTDPNTDLALIKIDEKELPFVKYGNSDELKVGEWVLAVGNPFNLTSTVTAGIVSAKGRSINIIGSDSDPNVQKFPIESFIQTDAAVNPGNSGGALVNTRGELVGINTAIASQTGSYAGYSFAIPVNLAQKVMDDLLKFGEVQRAFLGITMQDVNSQLAKEKDIKEVKGIYVQSVLEGGAAEMAGIKEGDVIVKVGGVTVNSMPELQETIGRHRPGDVLEVELSRNGKMKTVAAVLKNKDLNTSVVKKKEYEVSDLLGADLSTLSNKEKSTLKINEGVKISKLNSNSKLRNLGVQEGFIITKVNNKAVASKEDVENAVANNSGFLTVEGIYPNSPNTTRIFSFSIK